MTCLWRLLVLMLAVVVDPIDAFVRPPPRTRTTTPTTSRLVPLEAAASASNLRRIDDWTLTADGRIQGLLKDGSGDQVVTSQLADPEVAAAANGVIVTTQSGSRYKLLKQGTTRTSAAAAAAAPAAGTAANRNDPRSILSGYLRQKQQQAAPVEEEVVAVSKKTSGNKLPTAATALLGTCVAVAVGTTIGSGILGDGTRNSVTLKGLARTGGEVIKKVSAVGNSGSGLGLTLPDVNLPQIALPDLGEWSARIGRGSGRSQQIRAAVNPYVVKLPYLEEKIAAAESTTAESAVPPPAPPTLQPAQPSATAKQAAEAAEARAAAEEAARLRKLEREAQALRLEQEAAAAAAQEKAAQEAFQRKLQEAEEAAAREKKLEEEAAAAKAKASQNEKDPMLQMEAQKAVAQEKQAAEEFQGKLAQAEEAAVAQKAAEQVKVVAQQKSTDAALGMTTTATAATRAPLSSSSKLSTFEKWQQAQIAKARAGNGKSNTASAASMKPPAASKAAFATSSKLSTYDAWQARQRAKLEGGTVLSAKPIVPNAPPGSVGRMTSAEEAFVAFTGVGFAAATLGWQFTRDNDWDETSATPSKEISNKFQPMAQSAPPTKVVTPPPAPQPPRRTLMVEPPPPPPETTRPAPVTPVVPAKTEMVSSPTHEILPLPPPPPQSAATASSTSNGNYLQALSGGSSASSSSLRKQSYLPFGGSKTASSTASTVANGNYLQALGNDASTTTKKLSFSPFGSNKPIASGGHNFLYGPPAAVATTTYLGAVDTVSSSPEPTMDYSDSLTNGELTKVFEATMDGASSFEQEGAVSGISHNDNEVVEPLAYTSMPNAPKVPYGKTSFSPFGSKPKAAAINDSLYGPPSKNQEWSIIDNHSRNNEALSLPVAFDGQSCTAFKMDRLGMGKDQGAGFHASAAGYLDGITQDLSS